MYDLRLLTEQWKWRLCDMCMIWSQSLCVICMICIIWPQVTWPASKCVCAISIYALYHYMSPVFLFIYLFILLLLLLLLFFFFFFFEGGGGGVGGGGWGGGGGGGYDLLCNGAYAWYWLSRRARSKQVKSVCIWHMHDAPITQGVKIPCICYLYDLSPLTGQWL